MFRFNLTDFFQANVQDGLVVRGFTSCQKRYRHFATSEGLGALSGDALGREVWPLLKIFKK